jgi:phosphatidylserine decarboxylase
MNLGKVICRIAQQEDINFLLTNRIPRLWMTRFFGWFSQIERRWVVRTSIALWRLFAALELHEAKKTRFSSLHDCFIRELKDGMRPVNRDAGVLTSPCDAIVGAIGQVNEDQCCRRRGSPTS